MHFPLAVLLLATATPCAGPLPSLRYSTSVSEADAEASKHARDNVLSLMDAGDDQAALHLLTELLPADIARLGADEHHIVLEYTLLAMLQANTGHPAEAHTTVRRLFGIPPEKPLFRHVEPEDVLLSIAALFDTEYVAWRDEGLFSFLVEMLGDCGRDCAAARAAALFRFGMVLKVEHRHLEARVAFESCLAAIDDAYGPRSPRRAECLNQLAIAEESLCNNQAARVLYVEAVQLALHGCPEQRREVPRYLENYEDFLRTTGTPGEALFVASIRQDVSQAFSQ